MYINLIAYVICRLRLSKLLMLYFALQNTDDLVNLAVQSFFPYLYTLILFKLSRDFNYVLIVNNSFIPSCGFLTETELIETETEILKSKPKPMMRLQLRFFDFYNRGHAVLIAVLSKNRTEPASALP